MGWVFSIAQGVAGYQAAQSEEAQYKFNAKSELIAADEDSAARLADLNGTLSSINAIRTSRGLEVASPTGQAITAGVTKKAETGIHVSRLNYLTRAQSDLFGAYDARMKGQYALLGGFASAFHDFENAAMAAAGGG